MEPKINWDAIDTVLLDMDGTILDLRFDNYFWLELLPQKYAEKNNISFKRSQQFLTDSYGAIEGKLQWYCLDFWSERLKIDLLQLKESIKHLIAFRPGAVQFLEFLVEQEKIIYLVTNAHPKSLEIKLLNVKFHQYFNDLSSSHQFGYPKEEQVYWELLLAKYQFDPQRTLFVDDNINILKAAKKFGIKYTLGIAQPDMKKNVIDQTPFESINDFSKVIKNG